MQTNTAASMMSDKAMMQLETKVQIKSKCDRSKSIEKSSKCSLDLKKLQ